MAATKFYVLFGEDGNNDCLSIKVPAPRPGNEHIITTEDLDRVRGFPPSKWELIDGQLEILGKMPRKWVQFQQRETKVFSNKKPTDAGLGPIVEWVDEYEQSLRGTNPSQWALLNGKIVLRKTGQPLILTEVLEQPKTKKPNGLKVAAAVAAASGVALAALGYFL